MASYDKSEAKSRKATKRKAEELYQTVCDNLTESMKVLNTSDDVKNYINAQVKL